MRKTLEHRLSRCWILAMLLAVTGGTQCVPLKSKINIHPAAARVFPSAQHREACDIITIKGLGLLDGDYVLADNLNTPESRPTWIGASAATQDLALSYQPDHLVWAIGANGFVRAFLNNSSSVPSARSSRWHTFNEESSKFEKHGSIVSISCPACSALTVTTLPEALASCDGPYRLQVTDGEAGIFVWSHVNDERCSVLHDNDGNSFVAMDNQASSGGPAVRHVLPSKEGWTEMVQDAGTLSSQRGGDITCTSAGRTTRLIFDLMETQQGTADALPVEITGDVSKYDMLAASASQNFELTSRQDGLVVSSSYTYIHLRVSRTTELAQEQIIGTNAGPDVQETRARGDIMGGELFVRITADGTEVATVPLQRASIEGVLLYLGDRTGTWVFEICLFEDSIGVQEQQKSVGEEGCKAETSLIIEIFSADTQMIQRRHTSNTALYSGGSLEGLEATDDSLPELRVVFVIDLEIVDGYKLSTLHLMKHLPSNFRASALDLSCAAGELPVKEIFQREAFQVSRLCIQLPKETWDAAERQGLSVTTLFYSVLVNATTWAEVISANAVVARALDGLYIQLATFDVFVMSNGGRDADAYLLHVARLAGVSIRVVNLGAITGGYMSPLFSGATSIVGPSHYVAYNPAVIRNAGDLSVKVCHPVMDAARVLSAAHSCHVREEPMPDDAVPAEDIGTFESPEYDAADGGGGAEGAGRNGALMPTRFVMVGQLAAYKTPGMFVRAVAVLARRWAGGKRGGRRVEGIVVGNGPLRRHMEILARDLNASVLFRGALPVDAVPCEVQRATALVLPSTSPETFGMEAPEAMILGVPVVTFGFGGTGELVRHMENGIVVAEPTPRALADALELLATDTRLRRRLGSQARSDARGALSLREMVACHAEELRPPRVPSLGSRKLP